MPVPNTTRRGEGGVGGWYAAQAIVVDKKTENRRHNSVRVESTPRAIIAALLSVRRVVDECSQTVYHIVTLKVQHETNIQCGF